MTANPIAWNVGNAQGSGLIIAVLDLTDLLMWAANVDGNGTFAFYQTIDDAE
jgi:hypothetical protein